MLMHKIIAEIPEMTATSLLIVRKLLNATWARKFRTFQMIFSHGIQMERKNQASIIKNGGHFGLMLLQAL